MVALGTIHDWSPAAGVVTSWDASPEARSKARNAPEELELRGLEIVGAEGFEACDTFGKIL